MKCLYLLLFSALILVGFIALDKPTFSIDGFEKKSLSELYNFMKTPKGEWPEEFEVNTVVPSLVEGIKVTYVNHATFLIQINKKNILIDPIWSMYASPVQFAGPKRIHEPGINFDDLPRIDYVLITHNHYDHLDLSTLKKLYSVYEPKFLVGLELDKYLQKKIHKDLNVTSLNWGENFVENDVEFVFEKAFHWSKRGMFDYNDTLWGSFVIKALGRTLYHAGDTGYSNHFKEIGEKYEIDFAMLPVGDYEPRWFMKQSHTTPLEAFTAMQELSARQAVGMHFGTFQLASNSYQKVFDDFNKASDKFPDLNFVLPNVAQEFYVE